MIESLSRFGGKISSTRQDGFLVEGGPDSFLTQKTAALELCRDLGLEDQLLGMQTHGASIWNNGELQQIPDGMLSLAPTKVMPFLQSPLISWQGKLRIGLDLFISPRTDGYDESLGEFVRRRLGAEALHKIADPILAGIHAADPEKLSVKSAFPSLLEMERRHSGLLRAALARNGAQASTKSGEATALAGSAHPPLLTLRRGLQQMVDALLAHLDPADLKLERHILSITREQGRYEVLFHGHAPILADAILFATPADVTARLLERIDLDLSSQLRGIRYVSSATVSLGFRRAETNGSLRGSGFMVPHSESRRILGCTWSSNKFGDRAPQDYVLARVFIGGARAEHLAEQDDAALTQLACEELQATAGICATPVMAQVYRWHKAIPQYEVGHYDRIAGILHALARHRGLHLAGSAYHGTGIPDCIASGKRGARMILADITNPLPEAHPSFSFVREGA